MDLKTLEVGFRELTNKVSELNFKVLELEKKLRAFEGKSEKKNKLAGASLPAWEAYEKAFCFRYGVAPIRNAKVNAQCADLTKRLGKDAAAVIEFYVSLQDQQFVRLNHPIGILLQCCESVYTMWKRGKMTTAAEARAAEKSGNNQDASAAYLERKYGRR